jgi:dTDP-4-amino-4,6-dideoxygalactose transaminase
LNTAAIPQIGTGRSPSELERSSNPLQAFVQRPDLKPEEHPVLGMLPTELWDYSVRDALSGVCSGFGANGVESSLSFPGIGDCLPIRSARAGLVIALRALELQPGSRIGVPLYCCSVVFKAVRAASCVPVFIDIDPSTFCMSPADLAAKSRDVDAVIAVHSFGHVCDIAGLQLVLGGKPIIEDCAQSLGSKMNGRTAGSMAEIGVFSFRSGKLLSVGEGGALWSANPVLHSRMRDLVAQLPAPSQANQMIHVLKTYARSKLRSRPLYGIVGRPLWNAYGRNTDFISKTPVEVSRIKTPDLALARQRLTTLAQSVTTHRRNASFYLEHLRVPPSMLSHEPAGAFYNRYSFPVRFTSAGQCDAMESFLCRQGIEPIRPVKDVPEVCKAHFNYTSDCPVSEGLTQRVLALPCHSRLSLAALRRIANAFNAGWERLSGSSESR